MDRLILEDITGWASAEGRKNHDEQQDQRDGKSIASMRTARSSPLQGRSEGTEQAAIRAEPESGLRWDRAPRRRHQLTESTFLGSQHTRVGLGFRAWGSGSFGLLSRRPLSHQAIRRAAFGAGIGILARRARNCTPPAPCSPSRAHTHTHYSPLWALNHGSGYGGALKPGTPNPH